MTQENVLSFPPSNVREWGVMRRHLEDGLRQTGHDEETIKAVSKALREPAMSALGQSVTVAQGGEQAVRHVNAWFSAVVNTLLMHLAMQVIRNIELERGPAGGRR